MLQRLVENTLKFRPHWKSTLNSHPHWEKHLTFEAESPCPLKYLSCKLAKNYSALPFFLLTTFSFFCLQGFDFRCILGKKLVSKLFYVVSVTHNYGRKRSKLFRLKECSPYTCY